MAKSTTTGDGLADWPRTCSCCGGKIVLSDKSPDFRGIDFRYDHKTKVSTSTHALCKAR